jgi:Transmembrane secretion effector
VQNLAPDWVRARVLAIFTLVYMGSFALGSAPETIPSVLRVKRHETGDCDLNGTDHIGAPLQTQQTIQPRADRNHKHIAPS